jgi:hypothetical protein
VATERIVTERMADLVDEAVERLPEADGLGGEVHAHRTRDEDHDDDLTISLTTAANHAGEALAISIATPFGSCTTTSAFVETMVAGTNVSGRAADAVAFSNRFLHRYNRSGTSPRLRENSAIVSPLCFHSSIMRRACSSFHGRLC